MASRSLLSSKHVYSAPVAVLDLSYIVTTSFVKISETSGHSRFAMLTSSLYHRILINITTCGGMEEENSFAFLQSCGVMKVMHRNPSEILSLSKGHPQLLQTNLLRDWQNTDNQKICVIVFDH